MTRGSAHVTQKRRRTRGRKSGAVQFATAPIAILAMFPSVQRGATRGVSLECGIGPPKNVYPYRPRPSVRQQTMPACISIRSVTRRGDLRIPCFPWPLMRRLDVPDTRLENHSRNSAFSYPRRLLQRDSRGAAYGKSAAPHRHVVTFVLDALHGGTGACDEHFQNVAVAGCRAANQRSRSGR